MKRLLGVLLALGLAVTVAADGTVVCTATPHSTGIEFSATPTSAAAGLQCDLPAAEDEGGGVDPRWDDLVAGWKLDESSDGSAPVARADVLGVYELTDNNTVPSVAGKIGNAASFTIASSEYFSNASGVMGADANFTFAGWVWINAAAGAQIFFYQHNGNFYLRSNAGNLELWTRAFADSLIWNGGAAIGTGAWHFVVAWHDASTNQLGLQLDDGVVTTGATGGPNNAGTHTRFGTYELTQFLGGRLDECYVFDVVKDAAWRTAMYNGGVGRSYPD